jgi:hypothetical protein
MATLTATQVGDKKELLVVHVEPGTKSWLEEYRRTEGLRSVAGAIRDILAQVQLQRSLSN